MATTALVSWSVPGAASAQTATTMTSSSGATSGYVPLVLQPVTVEGQEPELIPGGEIEGFVAHASNSATKTDTPLIETPQSISVVTADEIADKDEQTLDAALRYTSGVQTETRGGIATRYDMYTVRGFTADTYLDGMKLMSANYVEPQIDPYLLDRVDVLKGPASVLYGSSSPGGIVDQESKLPLDAPFHEVGGEIGNFGHYEETSDFSGPLDPDGHFLYRITEIGRTEEGQIDNTRNERIAVAPSFTWRPDADTSLTIQTFYQRDPMSTSYGSVPAQGVFLYNPGGTLPKGFYDGDLNFETFDRTQNSVGYQFEKRFADDWKLEMKGRWFHTDQVYQSVYGSALEADLRTLDRGTAESYDLADSYTLDQHVEHHIATGPVVHDLAVGFDYQYLTDRYEEGFGSAPSLDIFNPDYYQQITAPALGMTRANMSQYGLYFQDQAKLGHWGLTFSGRQDWVRNQTEAYGTTTDQDDSAFTFRTGLLYRFDDGLAPYYSYSQSFTPETGTDAYGKAFVPETGDQHEIGLKYQPPSTNALLTAALFDLDRNNVLTTDPLHPLLSVQTGEVRSRGLELEGKASLTDNINVSASYTYTDASYIKDNSGLQGHMVAAVPRHAASLWGDYGFHEGGFDGLILGAGIRYTGASFNPDESLKVPDYTLFDASVKYDLGHLSPKLEGLQASVTAQNLFDKKYISSCYYGDWCGLGYQRTVYAALRYRW